MDYFVKSGTGQGLDPAMIHFVKSDKEKNQDSTRLRGGDYRYVCHPSMTFLRKSEEKPQPGKREDQTYLMDHSLDCGTQPTLADLKKLLQLFS